jgi:hypothetical protein
LARAFVLYGRAVREINPDRAAVGQGPGALYRPPGSRNGLVFWPLRGTIPLIAAGRHGDVGRRDEFCF